MKTIVTHHAPDLDGICAIWLLKTFIPGWEEAVIAFVPAGKTLDGQPVDSNPDIVHVDTGFGKFDHHQTNDDTCSALKVYQSLDRRDKALDRLLHVVNDIDHFREVFFPNPTADFWEFSLGTIIDGLNLSKADNPLKLIDVAMDCLDGIYTMLRNKVVSEEEIVQKGMPFILRFGKALAIETSSSETVHLAQKMGYVLVVRKDPRKGSAHIKSIPREDIDLTLLYEEVKKADPDATWFLHASLHMLLNGSAKNPDMKPTKLSLSELTSMAQKIYG